MHSAIRRAGCSGFSIWLLFGALVLPLSAALESASAQPDFVATDADGQRWTGILRSLSPERMVVAGETTRELPVSDLWMAKFTSRNPVPFERGAAVLLANGDRLVAEPVAMDDVNLTVHWSNMAGEPPLEVPLETIRGIVLNVPQTSGPRTELLRTLRDRTEPGDLLILENGDRLTGELAGMDATSVVLHGAVGETKIERGGVRAIAFDPELISFPEHEGPQVLLTLVNGSSVTGRNLQTQPNDRLTLDAAFGAKLDVPLSAVAAMRFEGGRVVPLSSLEPAEYEFTPYLSRDRELMRDRSVAGGPLLLRGREYPRGLGMHSRSAATYELGGRFRRFEATVGLDDATDGGGSAVLAVEVDGERAYTSPTVTGRSEPLVLPPIDLAGKERLTLVVEFGPHADIQDHADWCDPVLIR